MLKLLGSVLILGGCGCAGALTVFSLRRTEEMLRQLGAALDFMKCELQYRMTPLPELCRMTGSICKGTLGAVFCRFAAELDRQITPDISICMKAALSRSHPVPAEVSDAMEDLGRNLGRFDLEGQIRGLDGVQARISRSLDLMTRDHQTKLKTCQTLSLCAGAALVILFI